MNASEFVRANIHHGADHRGQKLPSVRKLQPRVKANCRAVGKLKPSRLDKVSLGQRSLRGDGRPPERSRPADPIDGVVGRSWRWCEIVPMGTSCRRRPLAIQSQSRADMGAARLPVVVGVAVNNKAACNKANG